MPQVPPEVAVAMATGRTEFLALLKGRLARGETLDPTAIDGLIDLCKELIESTRNDQQRIQKLEGVLKKLENLQKGAEKAVAEMRAVANRIAKDLPITADDEG